MAAWEGALYGGKTWQPSALVLYIMAMSIRASQNTAGCSGTTLWEKRHGSLPGTI